MRKSITNLTVLLFAMCAFVQTLIAQTPSQIFEKSFYPVTSVEVKDVQLDNSGNSYCWGYSGNYYFVIKYNANGVEQWRLNGLNNNATGNYSYNFNSTIEQFIVDGTGNCFFTGIGYSSTLGNRLCATKISTNGTIAWSKIDTTAAFATNGYRITLDANGNPIVLGLRSESYSKVYVVKYNKNSGAFTWAKVYEFVAGQYENVWAIATDTIGNVYICGDANKDATAHQNIYTLKLNSGGNFVWLKDYDGNSNNDYARKLYVNKAGSIIYSIGYGYFATTTNDWVVIKYDGSGNQQWAKNIDAGANNQDYAQTIAVDNSGNLFVAGQQYSAAVGSTFAILKLNPVNGNTIASIQDGEPLNTNALIDLAIDNTNKIYASYSNYDVMVASRYSNGLVNQWSWNDVNHYCIGVALEVNSSGQIITVGKNAYTTEPNKIVKIDAAGQDTWTNPITSEYVNGNEFLYDYVVDNNGDIYAAAYAGETSNLIVYRLNRNGDVVWKNYFSSGTFRAYDIKLDAAGANVYVCGTRASYMGLIKYNAATGTRLWSASYNAPGSGNDIAYELALDNNNNIYLTGKGAKNATEGYNIYTLKYNSNGQRQWAVDFTGTPGVNSDEYGTAIVVDENGNSYVAGSAYVTNKGYEFTVLKYNTSGVLQYSKLLSGGNFNSSDEAYDIAVDNAGNAYACGYYYNGAPEYYSGVIIKLNSTGGVTFTKQYNGITNQGTIESVYRIYLDNTNVIGVGTLRKDPSITDYDMFTVKLNTAGAQSWIKYYENIDNTAFYDYGYGVYKDARGNVYSLGISKDTLWTLIKYDSLGAQKWIYSFDRNTTYTTGYPNYDSRPYLAFDNYGAVYVGGTSYKAYSGYNQTFIKFCEYPPVPAVTASGPLSFCDGDNVNLAAAQGIGYQWSNGASSQAINVTTAGSYTVTVTYPNGCVNTSNKKTVNVYALPTPAITPGGPTTFCDGGSVTLNAGSFSSYLWNNGATTQSIIADATGNYRVTVTNANGCTGSSAQVAVVENPLPAATFTVTGPTTFCAGDSVKFTANNGAGLTYQWRKNNANIAGATAKIYYAKTQGNYTVRVINANTCSKTSIAVAVTVNCKLMQPDIENAEMTVYPNPTSGMLHLQATGIEKNVLIKVYDATGKLIFEKTVETVSGEFNYDVDLTSYQQGIYRLELFSGNIILRKQAFKIE